MHACVYQVRLAEVHPAGGPTAAIGVENSGFSFIHTSEGQPRADCQVHVPSYPFLPFLFLFSCLSFPVLSFPVFSLLALVLLVLRCPAFARLCSIKYLIKGLASLMFFCALSLFLEFVLLRTSHVFVVCSCWNQDTNIKKPRSGKLVDGN